jgi:micrococcal nuclease
LAPVGTVVELEHDVQPRDRYGRTLACSWTQRGAMVNEKLVRRGFAATLTYAPNVHHVERIRAAQTEAQRRRRDLWSTSALECAPRDHRAGRY